MDIYFDRIKPLIDASEKSNKEIERTLSLPKDAIYNWNKGVTNSYTKFIKPLAKYFNVSTDYINGLTDVKSPLSNSGADGQIFTAPGVAESFVTFPVMGDVAAGYDYIIYEDYTGDTIDVALSNLKGRKPEEFFVLRVVGNSMYPQYHEGDYILVLRRNELDYSGQIGVVLYDDDKVTLKRVEHADGWMRLTPINPQFEPFKIEGEAIEHSRILGIPKLLIREIED